MNRRNIAVALFALACAACSNDASVGTAVHSIINGTTDSGDPAVVLVGAQMPGSQSGSLCTGEIISPHVVLTAAHCVSPDTVGAGSKFIVFVGPVLDNTAANSDFLPVLETHYDMMFDLNNPTAGHDVGVVILKNPTTITPIPYNRTALPQSMVGQAARLVGYGITMASDTMGTTAGTRRQAPTKLASFDALLLNFQDMQHNICEGDSGGPAFMTIDGTEKIVGVTSYGFQGCPVSMPGTDTRVDAYASFIDQYVLQFDPPAKGPGDDCTSDADCFPRTCQQSGATKICAQPCDPAAMPSVCSTGTMCTSVDSRNICAKPAASGGSSGGCSVATGPAGASFFAFAVALLLIGAARRRIRN